MQIFALRTLRIPALAAVLLCTLAGCGGGTKASPRRPDEGGSATSAPASNSASTPSAKVTKAGVALKATAGSAAAGTATLDEAEGKVQYHVDVTGTDAGPHALYILQNATCATSGNRTGPLNPLDAAAEGHGTAEGSILTQLSTLVGRSLAVYAGSKGDSDVVACGPIVAAQ